MNDFPHLRSWGQYHGEMTAPARRVFSLPPAPHLCPIKYCFNAAAHPRRGLWLDRPNRFEGFKHQCCIDGLHRHFAEHWVGIGFKGASPLGAVLGVAPRHLIRIDISRCCFPERHGPSGIEMSLGLFVLSLLYGVDPLIALSLCVVSTIA